MACGGLNIAINYFTFNSSHLYLLFHLGLSSNLLWLTICSRHDILQLLVSKLHRPLHHSCLLPWHNYAEKQATVLANEKPSPVEIKWVTLAYSQHLEPDMQIKPSWTSILAESLANCSHKSEPGWNQHRHGQTTDNIVRNNKL